MHACYLLWHEFYSGVGVMYTIIYIPGPSCWFEERAEEATAIYRRDSKATLAIIEIFILI